MGVLIGFIAAFATIFGIFYVFYVTRNKERLALIDKGADASLFDTGKEKSKSMISWNKVTLKVGMFFMGIALGIIAGAILDYNNVLYGGAAYTSMIFFFGGMSLVIYYLIERKS